MKINQDKLNKNRTASGYFLLSSRTIASKKRPIQKSILLVFLFTVSVAFANESGTSAGLHPLYKIKLVDNYKHYSALVGRDPQLVKGLDESEDALKQRKQLIEKLSVEANTSPLRSKSYIEKRILLIKSMEQQALVFELMRVLGHDEYAGEKVETNLTLLRRRQIQKYHEMLLAQPKDEKAKGWKIGQMIARLRLGDLSSRIEIEEYVKDKLKPEERSLLAVAMTADAAARRYSSPFGSADEFFKSAPDDYEKATFKIIAAEQKIQEGKVSDAIPLYFASFPLLYNLRSKNKKPDELPLIEKYVASKIIANSLANDCIKRDEIAKSFVKQNAIEYARAYLETCALKNSKTSLSSVLKGYVDILALGQLSEQEKIALEIRMLDLTLSSSESQMIVPAWERIIKLGLARSPEVESRSVTSLQIMQSHFKRQPDAVKAKKLLQLNDLLVKNSPSFADRNDLQIKTLELLYENGYLLDVIARSDRLVSTCQNSLEKANLYTLNINSRLQLLGFKPNQSIPLNHRITSGAELLPGLLSNTDSIVKILPKDLGFPYSLLAAQFLLVTGRFPEAIQRFEAAFGSAIQTPLAAKSSKDLWDFLEARSDHFSMEKILAVLQNREITPDGMTREKVKSAYQKNQFLIAERLLQEKKFETAALKFKSFAERFPQSEKNARALERSAFSFGKVFKINESIAQYNLFLEKYPDRLEAIDIRWQIAEQYYTAREFLRAAESFKSFQSKHPNEGSARGALIKSAESLRFAGKLNESIAEYNHFLKGNLKESERERILILLVQIAEEAKNDSALLSALERLLVITKGADQQCEVNNRLLKLYKKLERDDLVKKTADTILKLKPTTVSGFETQSIARYTLARFDVNQFKREKLKELNQSHQKKEMDKLMKDFDGIKIQLLSPCDLSISDYCLLGNYEIATLAGDLLQLFEGVQPTKFLPNETADELVSQRNWNIDKLKIEIKNSLNQMDDLIKKTRSIKEEELKKFSEFIEQARKRNPPSSDTAPETQF